MPSDRLIYCRNDHCPYLRHLYFFRRSIAFGYYSFLFVIPHGLFSSSLLRLDLTFAANFSRKIFKLRILLNIPTIYGACCHLWYISCPFLETNVNLCVFVSFVAAGESSCVLKDSNRGVNSSESFRSNG